MTQYVSNTSKEMGEKERKKNKTRRENRAMELNSYTYTIRFSFISNATYRKSALSIRNIIGGRTNTSLTIF